MPFNVDHEAEIEQHEAGVVTDLRAHLHEKLDTLIDRTITHGGASCEVTVAAEDDTELILRLTLCDFTGEKICSFCDGTGVDGS